MFGAYAYSEVPFSSQVSADLGVSSSLSAAGTVLSIANLSLSAASSLVGSLAQLSASTLTVGGASLLTASGSLQANADQFKNFNAGLSSSTTISATPGFLLGSSAVLSGGGTVSANAMQIKNASSSLSASGSMLSIGGSLLEVQRSFNATLSVDAISSVTYSPYLPLTGSGTISPTVSFTAGAKANLSGSSSLLVYPLLIEVAASLQSGSGNVTAYGGYLNLATSSSSSNSSITGNLDMIYNVSVVGTPPRRVTESGDVRITESGDFRVIGENLNIIDTEFVANATVIPFVGEIYGHRQGAYSPAVPYVKYNGSWVVPNVYVKDQGIWKRVY